MDDRIQNLGLRNVWGAAPADAGHWRFGLWAPGKTRVEVEIAGRRTPLDRDAAGFHSGFAAGQAGEPYVFIADGDRVTDPASRAQADGVEGPSLLIDPNAFRWKTGWRGRPWEEAVIYELHLGTFTREGTFAAASQQLPDLAALGITAIELMPVAHFAGNRGWGYDGALLYAPHPVYGTPDDMRALVDAAHAAGIMVILDVVMNHFGAIGNPLHDLVPEFFIPGSDSPWGARIDYEKRPVRDFFLGNALCWLQDYRLDGLRFDAVHEILDPSTPDLMSELTDRVRDAGFDRPIHLIAEDERNLTRLREQGFAGQWNDDYHHALHCALTGEADDHLVRFAAGPIDDLAVALADGQVEQGQPRPGQDGEPRGEPSAHLPWPSFLNFNQNHDQVGNRGGGERLLTLIDSRGAEVAHALLICAPFTPLLFMGEEVGEKAPFLYFCDLPEQLAKAVREGRAKEFSFDADVSPDPNDPATLDLSRPFRGDPDRMAYWRDLTRRLLDFRHKRVVPLLKGGRSGPAQVTRTGLKSLRALWPHRGGTIIVHVNLGAAPDALPDCAGADIALYDPASDPFAFAVEVR